MEARSSEFRRTLYSAVLAGFATVGLFAMAVPAHSSEDLVRGFFCASKADLIAFLTEKAKGESEMMAANTVNKRIAAASCMPYLPRRAALSGEHTVFSGGLVFNLQSYVFSEDAVEYWTGSALGALPSKRIDQNI